jgi:hypothetical protein
MHNADYNHKLYSCKCATTDAVISSQRLSQKKSSDPSGHHSFIRLLASKGWFALGQVGGRFSALRSCSHAFLSLYNSPRPPRLSPSQLAPDAGVHCAEGSRVIRFHLHSSCLKVSCLSVRARTNNKTNHTRFIYFRLESAGWPLRVQSRAPVLWGWGERRTGDLACARCLVGHDLLHHSLVLKRVSVPTTMTTPPRFRLIKKPLLRNLNSNDFVRHPFRLS